MASFAFYCLWFIISCDFLVYSKFWVTLLGRRSGLWSCTKSCATTYFALEQQFWTPRYSKNCQLFLKMIRVVFLFRSKLFATIYDFATAHFQVGLMNGVSLYIIKWDTDTINSAFYLCWSISLHYDASLKINRDRNYSWLIDTLKEKLSDSSYVLDASETAHILILNRALTASPWSTAQQ